MTMKIEAGKFYRTRDGQKVGPMEDFCAGYISVPGDGNKWNADGTIANPHMKKKQTIIAEWADTPDLTTLTTPFGLLDRETQEALKAHGGPYECYGMNGWVLVNAPAFFRSDAYRVKPAPPKPREWWIVEWSDGDTQLYSSNDDAEDAARSLERNGWHNVKIIHVIKKLPD